MAPALSAELLELEAIRRLLLVLCRDVIPVLALGALKRNVVSWHNPSSIADFTICDCRFHVLDGQSQIANRQSPNRYYSITSDTVPAPTVRPPSRIANLNPFSIAIGAINSIVNCELSPGITISTPSFNVATPVTSVVRN